MGRAFVSHPPTYVNEMGVMSRRARILVVEDDPLVGEILLDAFQDDYDATQVEDARSGLQRLRDGGIDLVLLDCTLPGGLGDELIPQSDRAGIPILLMSGNPDMASQIGGDRPFILKPFTLSQLIAAVEQLLRPPSRP